uniref:Uncharacterized protein n=1 Tax=Arundo donax TaxID=35708 RepID=A0A0A8YEL5_ARUDO
MVLGSGQTRDSLNSFTWIASIGWSRKRSNACLTVKHFTLGCYHMNRFICW